jgi:hypothetical protein
MAGSTISRRGRRTNGSQTSISGGNDNHGHQRDPAPANHRTYRVTIDVRKIQANVYANEGGRLSELAVRNWLRSVGFHPEAGGKTWLGDVESLSRLDKSEIVRSERLHGPAARV